MKEHLVSDHNSNCKMSPKALVEPTTPTTAATTTKPLSGKLRKGVDECGEPIIPRGVGRPSKTPESRLKSKQEAADPTYNDSLIAKYARKEHGNKKYNKYIVETKSSINLRKRRRSTILNDDMDSNSSNSKMSMEDNVGSSSETHQVESNAKFKSVYEEDRVESLKHEEQELKSEQTESSASEFNELNRSKCFRKYRKSNLHFSHLNHNSNINC